jgi:flagellar protein FlaJ
MTFTDALKQIDRSDLGALDEEVSKLLADVEWGARTEKALYRFSARLQSSTISRIVALITNAMNASGNIGPVIRIAADEAREDRRLKQKRKQEMFMYVLIIYISFFVFLGIGLALQQILIPAIPTAEELGGIGGNGGGAGGGAVGGAAPGIGGGGADLPIDPIPPEEQDKYTLVLYHAAMVQAVCSGLVAGKMGSGTVRDGAKHVAIMLGIAYAVFLVVAG